ncbi:MULTISPECIES: hypothetical protein [Streptomyces]|uniref:Uncharacterized protein n=2 Tax=Streptomyces TaxID=1883 RepID=A0A5N5ECT4_9ACTN|nr:MULTISPECIES: hypothetical protein [Streptomyces]KAB2587743.1 hypothetical protein F5983_36225 [Streptomyces arboris]QRV39240.1 hypothetical protein I6J42_34815 [Streptomyces californicus]QRV52692.1 hypothetical protein I6J43_34835 [Streptomyces californicus]
MSDEQSGIQVTESVEIPAQVTVTEVPAAVDARDALLRAIGQEAQHVADKSAGQASAALEALARAYALVSGSGTAANVVVPGTQSRQLVTMPLSSHGTTTLLRVD